MTTRRRLVSHLPSQRGPDGFSVLPAAPLMAFDEPTQSYRWLGDALASNSMDSLQQHGAATHPHVAAGCDRGGCRF